MRVIAGRFRSRTLGSLAGQETRPTYDRLKETLFNVLASQNVLKKSAFLDLFAGTGSIGIEALSRGAAHAYFVEKNHRAARVIADNLKSLGLENEAEVFECEAAEAIRRLGTQAVELDICFLDPPYRMQGAYEQTLRLLGESSILKPTGIVVAEHEKRFDPGDGTEKLLRFRLLTQGESSLSFYRRRES